MKKLKIGIGILSILIIIAIIFQSLEIKGVPIVIEIDIDKVKAEILTKMSPFCNNLNLSDINYKGLNDNDKLYKDFHIDNDFMMAVELEVTCNGQKRTPTWILTKERADEKINKEVVG
ncbi:hypothetical protein CMI37_30035 [Candidatus Pacearchaeota archaeon]|nr:hypothetical protein [Candidatus Pacearchaeota archaeon]|tara:strand:+ start:6968 stop:7321 length:354 start_codon:yes stop_codon:yes gene_type:complete